MEDGTNLIGVIFNLVPPIQNHPIDIPKAVEKSNRLKPYFSAYLIM